MQNTPGLAGGAHEETEEIMRGSSLIWTIVGVLLIIALLIWILNRA